MSSDRQGQNVWFSAQPEPAKNGHHEDSSPGQPGWEWIGPKAAEVMLEKVPEEQRERRPSYIERLADDMANGHWVDSTDPIVISKEGYLLNGQHRLSAVVKSGQLIRFLVVRGVDRKSYGVMDRGLPRTTVDTLRADGLSIGKNEVATVRSAMGLYRTRGVSDRHIYRVYTEYSGPFSLVQQLDKSAHAVLRGCLVRALVFYSDSGQSWKWQLVRRLISLLRSEIRPEEYTPQDTQWLLMWERHRNYPQTGAGKSTESRRYMALISRYAAGEVIMKSVIPESDPFPKLA